MKKSVAFVGASVLGLAGVAGGATAASAAPLPAQCTDATQHTLSASPVAGAAWYMDCVPQYGLGKAEFTIQDSAAAFPAGFVPLTDPSVTVTSTTAPAPIPYFGSAPTGDFIGLTAESGDANSQTYSAHYVAPVLGVSSILPSALPAACDPVNNPYNSAYSVSYGATSTSFTQTTPGGVTETYTIAIPARTLFLGFTITANQLDRGTAACATDGTTTTLALVGGDPKYDIVMGDHATIANSFGSVNPDDTFDPLGLTLNPATSFPSPTQLGTFAVTPAAAPAAPTATATGPALAATGQNSLVPAGAGVLLLALGGSLAWVSRRRRRGHRAS